MREKGTKSNKSGRIEVLKMIIGNHEISTQDDLLSELSVAGYPCTQATLSRDLHQLQVSKVRSDSGDFVYMLPGKRPFQTVSDTHVTVQAMNQLGALSIRFSGNIAVVKTLPGHASHVAYDIDNANLEFVLGTVAGDDTVMVVLAEDTERERVWNELALATHIPSKE